MKRQLPFVQGGIARRFQVNFRMRSKIIRPLLTMRKEAA